jgi:glutathione S-transferase
MMKLYSMVPADSGAKVRWLLNELGQNFEDVRLSYSAGDLKTQAYLAKHPLGQVPVLEDGDVTLFESYAIVAYLADKFAENKLAPSPSDIKSRGLYYQWLFFSIATVEDFFARYARRPDMKDEYLKDWGDYITQKIKMILTAVEKQLGTGEYILGSFSAVDICLGCALASVAEEKFFLEYPLVQAYHQRLVARPACKKSEIF